jgi:Zn-dependent protease with chaperone function
MINIEAKLFDGQQSSQTAVVLKVFENGAVEIQTAGGKEVLFRQSNFFARVSDRLAGTPRYLTFSNAMVLETDDNQSVDLLLKRIKGEKWTRLVHLLESKTGYIVAALILVILVGAGIVKYGMPAAAKVITEHLPASLFATADRQVLELMDRMVLKTSELPEEIEKRVRAHFQEAIDTHAPLSITLLFRNGGMLGPNAFALPGGTIIFTDELVTLAEHDDELLGIMAHEIGHVVHQHAMRRMVQGSMISFAFLALTGDASGVSEIFLGVPVVLTQLAYSRAFEMEADRYALNFLVSRNIPPECFAEILERIDQRYQAQEKEEKESRWTGYLSTHPPTSERVIAFRGGKAP